MAASTNKCLDSIKQCLSLLIPSLRPQAQEPSSGYHDPNHPEEKQSRSLKKKKYERVENPNSVSAARLLNSPP
jgi:hypothetical protein